jgi:ATP-dependent RNA helicase SUPV3L1/SUV3
VFGHIARDQYLPTDWLSGQIGVLARSDGDIDTLMQRLAGVRIWSYIAARADWVMDSAHWQGRAREVEDLLSDALHERLTSRFVDRRSAHLMRRLEAGETEELLSAVTRRGEVIVEGHPVGRIGGFSFFPDPAAQGDEKRLVLRAARRALREEMPRRVAEVEAAPDGALAFGDDNTLTWDGLPIARLRRGASALRPRVQMLDSEFLDGAQRERLRGRLQRFVDVRISHDLGPLLAAAEKASGRPEFRGLLHRLTEALGLILGDEGDILPPQARAGLKAIGVKAGRFGLFIPAVLKPRAAAMRGRLWGVQHGVAVPELPPPDLVSLPRRPDWPAGFADAMGWLEAGPMLLRLDIAEKVAAELAWSTRRTATAMPARLASRLSLRADMLPVVLRRLGFRIVPAGVLAADEFGPPAPAMLLPLRRRRAIVAEPPPARTHGPFAALAALKR